MPVIDNSAGAFDSGHASWHPRERHYRNMVRRISPQFNRRQFLGMAAASMAIPAGGAIRSVPAFAQDDGPHLILGEPSPLMGTAMINSMRVLDARGDVATSLQHPDGLMAIQDLPAPGYMANLTIGEGPISHIDSLVPVDFEWEDRTPEFSIMLGTESNGEYLNDRYMLISNNNYDRALLLDFRTRQGRDITEFVQTRKQEFVPVTVKYLRGTSLAGVWTGDHVWLLDLDEPERARALRGLDEEQFSTTIDFNDDGTWVSYTTYSVDDEEGAGSVWIESVADSDPVKVADGTAWSKILFVPGDPESFIVFNDRRVELRSVDQPDVSGEVIGDSLPFTFGSPVWSGDMNTLLYGGKETRDSEPQWFRFNAQDMSITPMPELAGLDSVSAQFPNTAPEYALFAPPNVGPDEERVGAIVGVDIASGESNVIVDEFIFLTTDSIHGSSDGRWFTIVADQPREMRGVHLIDVQESSSTRLQYGSGVYADQAYVSPDGSTIAVTMIEQPASLYRVDMGPTDNLDALETVGEGVALGWVS